MDTDTTVHQRGAHIKPIPPPLEFPFPWHSDESFRSSPTLQSTSEDSQPNTVTPEQASPEVLYTRATPAPRSLLASRQYPRHAAPIPSEADVGRSEGYAEGTPTHVLRNGSQPASDNAFSTSEEDEEISSGRKRSRTTWMTRKNKTTRSDKDGSSPANRDSDAAHFGRFLAGNDNYNAKGKVNKTSGRLDISIKETSNRGYLAKALGASLHHHLGRGNAQHKYTEPSAGLEKITSEETGLRRPDLASKVSTSLGVPTIDDFSSIPKLNIVIMVIGSRGDIQPFIKIGKLLKEDYGHRVRIATHPAFKKFVKEDSGLEFFSVGGDPSELMAFMVKNPGLIPSVATVKAGEVGRRRDAMFEMFQGFWRACINATDDETNSSNKRMMVDNTPFVADAIIANPPSFAHVHCAERLGIPLHLMFTFPYSPTQQFPHPLANIKSSNVDANYTNFISYPLVELVTWQGLGDLVNRFRIKTLGLEPVSTLWAPGQLFRLKVPYTYCWSPGLIPKPCDWGPEIDIAGFVFLDLASSFKPPETLSRFLEAGEPPVYIGFGSIVIDDPDGFTTLIFEAVKKAGVRALVSKGWGGLGGEKDVPDDIHMLENTPHDWLFPRVSAVVHHGGAGTTAIGLKCGKPTMIVPFFGDQPFWGSMVSRAGAGAQEAIPYKNLSVDALAEGIMQCLSPEAKASAAKIAQAIADEGDGAKNAVESFHRHLPLRGEFSMRCTVFPDRVAVWLLKGTRLRLSSLAAQIFVNRGKFRWQDLRLIRHYDWSDFEGPGEPLTGAGSALANTAGEVAKGLGGVPGRWAKSIKKHEKREKKDHESHKTSANATENQENPASPDSGVSNDQGPASSAQKAKDDSSPGGQCGTEQHLPEANTTGRNLSRLQTRGIAGKKDTFGPIPSNVHGSDDDEVLSPMDSRENIAEELAEDFGAGFIESGQALARAPMDLSLAVAQGFHNAPRLYGDTTVRTPIHITGFHSGLRAAGQEFAFGLYDGFTGLVLQPYNGAKENGALGFVTGVGKGIGGFVLKDLAAVFGPIGYTLKGVHKEMIKSKQPTAFITRSRIVQGQKDLEELDEEHRREDEEKVETAWRVLQQIKCEEDKLRSSGVVGRIKAKRIKDKLYGEGAFESVGRAKKVVEDRKMSRFIEENKKRNLENERKPVEQFKQRNRSLKKNKLVKFEGDTKCGGSRSTGVKRNINSQSQVDGRIEEAEQHGGLANDNTTSTAAGSPTNQSPVDPSMKRIPPIEHNRTDTLDLKTNTVS